MRVYLCIICRSECKLFSKYWMLTPGKPTDPWGEKSHSSNHHRAHIVKLGRMATWKINPLHPWPPCRTHSYRAYQTTQTPLFPNPLMLPFDTEVCHVRQICLIFHRILKMILEMAFSAHCTQIWKLNRISMIIISKVARKCIWCCHRVQRCVTAPLCAHRRGKIVQWSMKVWSR